MSPTMSKLPYALAAAAALLGAGAAAGYLWAQRSAAPHAAATAGTAPTPAAPERKVLYWYDPMSPATRFDKPGKSPFMDMQLVPMYADADEAAGTVRIDPGITQNLGLRLATVTRTHGAQEIHASGVLGFNERELAVVQARSGGFVERVPALAPGDVLPAGALLAELLLPEWAAVQQEALALQRLGQAELLAAAQERMRLAGMPEELIRSVLASGQVQSRVAIRTPRAGVIQELEVRAGMNLMAGATLARIQGLGTVWLEAGVPEAQSAAVRVGQAARIQLASRPGETLDGKVAALLPALNDAARTLRVRIELPNPGGALRPGLSAQVRLLGATQAAALAVPTEAVIRTGQRALVMLAEGQGRYRPVEVLLGGELGSLTLIQSGLAEGQQVVASGQFLIDSEASLKGIRPQPTGSQP
ncbi:efflux RND transporter periplasmic adaptor subunit [Inhella proteolytica]|uniref:Efflux RND transporter periplasmic adaptor subunit n=1 Tax=Inhella proteolytica TaxID=2795029 RepID=A0A931NGE6_9BURK|nr:efflux RND transporter periplasmic adaptor subunit [Inhella proteolytica]MBH9577066.1 efflux RND transporter periplasmic adaptor subunit [Inhella proteolytica]